MNRFSAPINPERPRGEPSCAKCAHAVTRWPVSQLRACIVCDLGRDLTPCDAFRDASVERTERGGLKRGYDIAARPA